jgi:hypothetical protein
VSETSMSLRLPFSTEKLWSALLAHCVERSDLHPDAEHHEILERDATTLYRRSAGRGFEVTERLSIDERRRRMSCEVIDGPESTHADEVRYRVMPGEDRDESRLSLHLVAAGVDVREGDALLNLAVRDLRERLRKSR